MTGSTSVENGKNASKLAMFIGVDFINGNEFKQNIEMHQGKDIEISTKPNKEQNTKVSREGLEYYITRWTEAIKFWEINGEKNKIEKYKKMIEDARKILSELEKDDEMSK